MSCPGTIPADSVTCAPTTTSTPMVIEASPNTVPGGKASTEPAPNDAKRRAAAVSAVTAPRRWAQRQAQWIRREEIVTVFPGG